MDIISYSKIKKLLGIAELKNNKGEPNGYASLDSTGNVPASQLGNVTGGGGSVDIVDNLTSTDTDKALSAKQGKVLKDAADAHLAENVSKIVLITEPFDQGTKTTINLGFKPKNITIQAAILNTEYESLSFSDRTSSIVKFKDVSKGWVHITSGAIVLQYNDSNRIIGYVELIQTGIEITWTKTGTLTDVSGSRRLIVSATTHGEG